MAFVITVPKAACRTCSCRFHTTVRAVLRQAIGDPREHRGEEHHVSTTVCEVRMQVPQPAPTCLKRQLRRVGKHEEEPKTFRPAHVLRPEYKPSDCPNLRPVEQEEGAHVSETQGV